MTMQTPTTDVTLMFSADEWHALNALRERYKQQRDLFSARELAHLRFMRWLSHTGRLDS